MSSLKLLHSGGNGVIIAAPDSNPASDLTLKLPQADGSAGQVLKTDGSGALSFVANGTLLQTKYIQLTCANTEATNTTFGTTPEAIIDGCMVSIQITNTASKILVTYSGMPILAKRSGPATCLIDIGHTNSDSASATFNVGDFTGLGTGPDGGLASVRKVNGNTSSGLERGGASPACIQVLHDHNLAVGKYVYYTLMAKSLYSNNSHGYTFGGHSDNVHGCVLQEVM